MEVRFAKLNGGRVCGWTALRPPRTVVPGPTMAAGRDIPHDLATFVIEEALGIEFGFWGCVAAGATFRTLGRKRTPQGVEIIRRHLVDLDAAEARVNDTFFAWRRGEPTAVSEQLDGTLRSWRALPDGEELVYDWARAASSRRRR